MKIKLPKSTKAKIKAVRNNVFDKMCVEGISKQDWDELNRQYQAYTEMLKPTWKVTPDTLIVAATNLAGIILVLNFEKIDIVRSKAMSLLLKGRV